MKQKIVFNHANENISWAKYTWNPVTGCLHGCPYCYARDIAKRFYKDPESDQGQLGTESVHFSRYLKPEDKDLAFEPRFWPERLMAPFNTKIPKPYDIRNMSVFVCSMADLFGEWVPQEWIDQVMDVVRREMTWNYIFLTKNPERLLPIDWPVNTWVGATADTQERAERSLKVFREMSFMRKETRPAKTFLSCEPLLEGIDFQALDFGGYRLSDLIDWIIIGSQSRTSAVPAFQPEWEWVEKILNDGHQENLPGFFKPNLTVRPREYPR